MFTNLKVLKMDGARQKQTIEYAMHTMHKKKMLVKPVKLKFRKSSCLKLVKLANVNISSIYSIS